MFVGRLDIWQKGLDLLIEAFARARLKDTALVLVGPDARGALRALHAHVERWGVAAGVVFAGPAFGQELADRLAAADVFVHVSRWEGLSLSVLTAAAAGKPCLLTPDADPLAALGPAGAAVIVAPTVDSIAQGLLRCARLSPDELTVMGRRAREIAERHFTWPHIAHRLGQAYRTALAAPAPS
jgi:glycosyltransferase involved in cell wall biosynthesis